MLASRLFARKSEIKKKTLMLSTGMSGQIQKHCMPEIENLNHFESKWFEILNHLYFGPNLFFGGLL